MVTWDTKVVISRAVGRFPKWELDTMVLSMSKTVWRIQKAPRIVIAHAVQEGLDAIPLPPCDVEQTSKAHYFREQIVGVLKSVAPPKFREPRKPWIADKTLVHIDDKIDFFKYFTRLGKKIKHCFPDPSVPCTDLHSQPLVERQLIWEHILQLSTTINTMLKADIRAFVDTKHQGFALAAVDGLGARLHRAVRWLKPQSKRVSVLVANVA